MLELTDDVCIISQIVLLGTNILVTIEFATGYVAKSWDDRMSILVTLSSCGVTIGQTWSKTALAITLLKITNVWQRTTLWVIIGTLNAYLVILLFINWIKFCDEGWAQNWWRINACMDYTVVQTLKVGGNSKSTTIIQGTLTGSP